MTRVVIGMDPHKRSATIEVLDEAEQPLMAGRFGTDSEGYRLLLAAGRQFPERVWAVEGCEAVGRLWVPRTSSALCDLRVCVLVDQATESLAMADHQAAGGRLHRASLDR